MPSAISVLLKRWLALAAIVVLTAVTLAAGTLFAANERQQRPELPPTGQQSVRDATNPVAVVEPPAAPPAPERVPVQSGNNDQEETDLHQGPAPVFQSRCQPGLAELIRTPGKTPIAPTAAAPAIAAVAAAPRRCPIRYW